MKLLVVTFIYIILFHWMMELLDAKIEHLAFVIACIAISMATVKK